MVGWDGSGGSGTTVLAEQVGHCRVVEKVLDGRRRAGPAMVYLAGMRVTAGGPSHQAAPFTGGLERPHDAGEGEAVGRIDELKSPLRSPGRAQDAGPGEGVESLGEVVARGVERCGDVVHPDRTVGSVFGDVQHRAECVLGRTVEPHRLITVRKNLANIMII